MFAIIRRERLNFFPLQIALTALTDAYGKGPDHSERMRGCARVVHGMLWTWSGLLIVAVF